MARDGEPDEGMKRKQAIYGICRLDHAGSSTFGWLATIQRQGVIHRKFFSDGKHGGKAAALKAAKLYRDEIVARFPPMLKRQYVEILKPNNRSGVTGVCRICVTENRGRPQAVRRCYWVASWTLPNGRPRRRKFSVWEHGEARAFELAVRARRSAVKEMRGSFDPGSTRVRMGKSCLS
jgi:hypothetical protein